MFSFILFMLFCLIMFLIIKSLIFSLKNSPIKCNYKDNSDCDNFDESGIPICEKCEFYKMINEEE